MASLAFSKSKLVEEARQAMDAVYRWGWAEWNAKCPDVQAGPKYLVLRVRQARVGLGR